MRSYLQPNKLKMLAAASACALAAFGQPAFAAQFFPGAEGTQPDGSTVSFTVSGDPFNGPVSGGIERTNLTAGTFLDEFFFRLGQEGLGSGSVTTNLAGFALGPTDVDFNSVSFSNGVSTFDVPIVRSGGFEFSQLSNVPIFAGNQNVLRINYTARGSGSYGGQLSFQPTAAVPEPGTWAFMLFGFGAVGFAMRRRKDKSTDQRVRISYT